MKFKASQRQITDQVKRRHERETFREIKTLSVVEELLVEAVTRLILKYGHLPGARDAFRGAIGIDPASEIPRVGAMKGRKKT
jgi:hypothetical protein